MDPWFVGADGAVRFRANAGGATTSGSSYPRSELREMSPDGRTKAAWSTTSGTHTLTVRAAATHLPAAKPQVVMAQVHDASNDVVEIVADGTRVHAPGTHSICVRFNGGTLPNCLDDTYRPGTFVTFQISVHDGRIVISYNGTQKLDLAASDTGCYFKAGAYTQSNTSKGDSPDAYGEVRISALQVTHS
jgi:poly(beta-D-mannuronate) lyase